MANEPDRLDRMIDAALTGYSAAEPLDGLEERVLNKAFAQRPRVTGWWIGWAAATLAAALLLALGVAHWPNRTAATVHATPESRREVAILPPLSESPREEAPRRTIPARRKPVSRADLPKMPVFPTPSPLSDTERALLRFASLHPNEARNAGAWLQAGPPKEIVIDPIEIPPLKSDGEQ